MAPARPRLVGNALGSLAILALFAIVAIGLPHFDRSLPAARALVPGARFVVGAGVTLIPPESAILNVSQTRPGDQRGTALFTLGTVRYAVVVAPYHGTLAEAAVQVRGQITGKPGYQVAAADRPVHTDSGVNGRAGTYDSPGRSGTYAVYLSGERAVDVTVSGPDSDLRFVLPAVEASARSIAFDPRS